MAETGGRTRDLQTSVTSSALSIRAPKKRQVKGTDTDIIQEMLYCNNRPPLEPLSQSIGHELGPEEREDLITDSSHVGACKQVRGNAADLEMKRKMSRTDSDNESVHSAETFTIESDVGKEELRLERARIDIEFGVVPDSTAAADERPSSASSSSAHLPTQANVDDDVDECPSLQIYEELEELDQSPRLKRTTNQMLFPKNIENGASSGYSAGFPDVKGSAKVDRNLDNAKELAVIDRDTAVMPSQETKKSNWTSSQSSMKRLHSEVDGVVIGDGTDIALTCEQTFNDVTGKRTGNSKDASIRDDEDDDDLDEDDRSHSAAAQLLLKATENTEVIKNKLVVIMFQFLRKHCRLLQSIQHDSRLLLRFILKAYSFFLTNLIVRML